MIIALCQGCQWRQLILRIDGGQYGDAVLLSTSVGMRFSMSSPTGPPLVSHAVRQRDRYIQPEIVQLPLCSNSKRVLGHT